MIRERLNYYQKEIKQWLSLLISYIISLIIKRSKKDGPIQNPIIKLYTRTYDNANEAVHNKVLYFPEGLFGWKYWRCYTPFTRTNCKLENPSIAVSQDGYHWTTPAGLINPIENLETPEEGFNSDPHLLYNHTTQQLECWFRYCKFNGGEYIFRKKSSDGVKWSTKELMQTSDHTYQSLVCPVVIYNENNQYQIWILTNNDDSFKDGSYIKYYESIDGKKWNFIRNIQVRIEPDHMPWHFDIEKSEKLYHMVYSTRAIADYNNLNYIAYAYSSDNKTYKSQVLLKKSTKWYTWDNYKMHRPALTFINKKCLLYYSAQNQYSHWGTGVINISSIIIDK